MGSIGQSSTFSEYGHVAIKLKEITKYSYMVAKIRPNSTFSEHGHVAYFRVISCLFVVKSKLLTRGAVGDLMHYCRRLKAECNSASGRPRYRGIIV